MSIGSHVISLKYEKEPEREPPRIPPPIKPQKEWPRGWIYGGVGFLLLVALSWGSVHFGLIGSRQSDTATTTQTKAQNSTANTDDPSALIAAVGKLIALPPGEVPTVATVSDPSKLHDQQFFANAKVGDKVLIYTQAKKAYLYRPSLNILIEVASITTSVGQ